MSGTRKGLIKRLIIATSGGGFNEKCWGDKNYSELLNKIISQNKYQIKIIGGIEDSNRIKNLVHSSTKNYCGKLKLRQSAALVKSADFIICNSSIAMHLAGTFNKPSLVLLGEWYNSSILHQKQWGYINSSIVGKDRGVNSITSVDQAFKIFSEIANND